VVYCKPATKGFHRKPSLKVETEEDGEMKENALELERFDRENNSEEIKRHDLATVV
jgi:hypothetical protein